LSAAKLSINLGAEMEKMEEFLLTASVLQDNAKYLPEDFQVKEGDGSEREEVNAS
jgi:hypothetical protein